MIENQDSWREWSRHVLLELKRHDQNHDNLSKMLHEVDRSIEQKLYQLHADIITLKAKSSAWGAIAGAVGGAIISAIVSAMAGR